MAKNSFRFEAGGLSGGLNERQKKTLYAVEQLGYAESKRMEADAKRGAIWTDRTHRARDSIMGSMERRGTIIRVMISGGVNYLKYLEFAMQKRFAILWPTIDKHRDDFMRAIGGLWDDSH